MEKVNRLAWDVTRLRPIPPLQFYHNINEKNICVTKRREYKFPWIYKVMNCIPYYYKSIPFPSLHNHRHAHTLIVDAAYRIKRPIFNN